MKIHPLILVISLFFSVGFHSQNVKPKTTTKPVSIYTFTNLSTSINDFYALNKKLQLSNFHFVYVDQIDLDLNRFSFQFNDIGKPVSKLIYYDYQRYQNENLLKGFKKKTDPSYWNLHLPHPNLQQ